MAVIADWAPSLRVESKENQEQRHSRCVDSLVNVLIPFTKGVDIIFVFLSLFGYRKPIGSFSTYHRRGDYFVSAPSI